MIVSLISAFFFFPVVTHQPVMPVRRREHNDRLVGINRSFRGTFVCAARELRHRFFFSRTKVGGHKRRNLENGPAPVLRFRFGCLFREIGELPGPCVPVRRDGRVQLHAVRQGKDRFAENVCFYVRVAFIPFR